MKPKAPGLALLAFLWSALSLSLSYVSPDWSGPTSTLDAASSGNQVSSELPQTTARLAAEAKRLDEEEGQGLPEAAGVDAQTWSTAAEAWGQGEFDGTVALGEVGGISLVSGLAQGTYASPAWKAAFPITALAAEWHGDRPSGAVVTVDVRLGFDGSDWTSWQHIPTSHELEGSAKAWASELVGVSLDGIGPLYYVQYRVGLGTSPDGQAPVIESMTLTVLNSSVGPSLRAAKALLIPQEQDGGVPRPPIISRAGWGADESIMNWQPEYERPKKVIIHHTVTHNPDPLATIRAIYYYHAVSRGWGDIGYNFLIDDEGNVYEGRRGGDGAVGGHALAHNYGSVGIGLIGDFSEIPLPAAMEAALIEILAWVADRYGIAPQGKEITWGKVLPNVVGHRDVQNTSCPGQPVYERLPYLRAMSSERLLAYPPAVTMQAPESGEEVRGTVRVRASSSSPLAARLALYIGDGLVATVEGPVLAWDWDTTVYEEGQYTLRVVAEGRQELEGELTRGVVVDNSRPTGRIVINGGAEYARDRTVSLAIATADSGTGVAAMELAEDGRWQGSEKMQARRDWYLSSGDGVRCLAVRFWDRAGNVSSPYTDTIVLDTTAPAWDDACEEAADGAYIGVQDDLSGLLPSSAEHALVHEGEANWAPWEPSTCSGLKGSTAPQTIGVSFSMPLNAAIRFRVMDTAGNWSISPSCKIGSGMEGDSGDK